MLYLTNYKKLFKKFNFDKLKDFEKLIYKRFYKNIFIGTDINKSLINNFQEIIHKLENIYTYKKEDEYKKIIKDIYDNRPNEEDKSKTNKVLPTYALHFKNIHKYNNLLKKSYFKRLFHANKSYKTHFYIYEDILTKDFFTKKINLDYYSKCMDYLNAFDDDPLDYSNIDYIIIDMFYIKEDMKFIYDELLYRFIPVYKSYEKLINYYGEKYSTMIINYSNFDKDTYDYQKSINELIYFY